MLDTTGMVLDRARKKKREKIGMLLLHMDGENIHFVWKAKRRNLGARLESVGALLAMFDLKNSSRF